jgi:hypothetical protein
VSTQRPMLSITAVYVLDRLHLSKWQGYRFGEQCYPKSGLRTAMAYIAIVAMVEKTKQIKHITAKDCLGSGSGGCMHQEIATELPSERIYLDASTGRHLTPAVKESAVLAHKRHATTSVTSSAGGAPPVNANISVLIPSRISLAVWLRCS